MGKRKRTTRDDYGDEDAPGVEQLESEDYLDEIPIDEMSFSDLYGRDDLKCKHLEDQSRVVTIADIKVVSVKKWKSSEKIRRYWLGFKEFERGLVLNVTNGRRIADAYGDALKEWLGRTIELYPSETEVGGETVECIRVRIPAERKPLARKRTPTKRKKSQ